MRRRPRGQGLAVEARGVVDHRCVAAQRDVGDDVGDGAIDGFGGLARLRQQRGELGFKAGSVVRRRIMQRL